MMKNKNKTMKNHNQSKKKLKNNKTTKNYNKDKNKIKMNFKLIILF